MKARYRTAHAVVLAFVVIVAAHPSPAGATPLSYHWALALNSANNSFGNNVHGASYFAAALRTRATSHGGPPAWGPFTGCKNVKKASYFLTQSLRKTPVYTLLHLPKGSHPIFVFKPVPKPAQEKAQYSSTTTDVFKLSHRSVCDILSWKVIQRGGLGERNCHNWRIYRVDYRPKGC